MNLTSPDFKNNEKIPVRFTRDGENINPSLIVEGVPEDTRSLVLTVDDPDAPSGNWNHWAVWNIPSGTIKIRENSIPGIQGKNSFGANNYGGPSPPSGTHRYFFRIFALDIKLNLIGGSNREDLEKAMKAHILEKAELIGLYI